MPSFGGRGLFCSVSRCIVVLFYVRISIDLLLRNASFRTFTCFRQTLLLFGIMCLLSVVDSLIAHTVWNQVLQSRDEFVPACVIA